MTRCENFHFLSDNNAIFNRWISLVKFQLEIPHFRERVLVFVVVILRKKKLYISGKSKPTINNDKYI